MFACVIIACKPLQTFVSFFCNLYKLVQYIVRQIRENVMDISLERVDKLTQNLSVLKISVLNKENTR